VQPLIDQSNRAGGAGKQNTKIRIYFSFSLRRFLWRGFWNSSPDSHSDERSYVGENAIGHGKQGNGNGSEIDTFILPFLSSKRNRISRWVSLFSALVKKQEKRILPASLSQPIRKFLVLITRVINQDNKWVTLSPPSTTTDEWNSHWRNIWIPPGIGISPSATHKSTFSSPESLSLEWRVSFSVN